MLLGTRVGEEGPLGGDESGRIVALQRQARAQRRAVLGIEGEGGLDAGLGLAAPVELDGAGGELGEDVATIRHVKGGLVLGEDGHELLVGLGPLARGEERLGVAATGREGRGGDLDGADQARRDLASLPAAVAERARRRKRSSCTLAGAGLRASISRSGMASSWRPVSTKILPARGRVDVLGVGGQDLLEAHGGLVAQVHLLEQHAEVEEQARALEAARGGGHGLGEELAGAGEVAAVAVDFDEGEPSARGSARRPGR